MAEQQKIMLDPVDEDSVLRAVAAMRDAERALEGIDMRRYAGPKRQDTKAAIKSVIAESKGLRQVAQDVVRRSRKRREELG